MWSGNDIEDIVRDIWFISIPVLILLIPIGMIIGALAPIVTIFVIIFNLIFKRP